MNVTKHSEGTALTVVLEGRIDTTTAPQFEKEVCDALLEVTDLVLDMEKVEYISSAGLRVLLSLQKKMDKQGKMTIKHVNAVLMEIFEITGFIDILTVEQ